MNADAHKLVIITPVYEDFEASGKLFAELHRLFGDTVYVVAIDDGSVRQPLTIDHLAKNGFAGSLISLRRNVGHQKAIAIGLSYAAKHMRDDQFAVVMDSDGEDVPASIEALLRAIDADHVDVVVARRKSRVESLRFKAFYAIYKRIFHLLSGREISFGNFMALRARSVQRLAAMSETWIHVAGAVLASKLRVSFCPLDRGARYAGRSKMNFVGLVLHGLRGLMVFAEDVLVRVGIACAFIGGLSIFGGALTLLLKLLGYATPGWASLSVGLLVLVFLQTGTLALMTLMQTGANRNDLIVKEGAYQDFVASVTLTP
ncbi:glycosyltransferase [Methylovirgula sp. 4M-Z18]|nr:glycosyltransferase [Methylovirgula sp. 4M-Z18]